MSTDIDEKLTTLEKLTQLLDAGHVVVLRKTSEGFRIGSAACKYRTAVAPIADVAASPPADILLEGLPFATDWSIESATGRCLSDVVRAVVTLHDLPY